jgi:putative nucleotidyltransferase with HDIG domain
MNKKGQKFMKTKAPPEEPINLELKIPSEAADAPERGDGSDSSAPIETAPKEKRPSFVKKIHNSIQNWLQLQRDLRGYPKKTRGKLEEIERAFLAYRVTYASLTYKAPRIPEELTSLYDQITQELPKIEKETRRFPLFLRPTKNLRELKEKWDGLTDKQSTLLSKLAEAPKRLDFYDRMLIFREKKRAEKARQQENIKRLEAVSESIKKVIGYVESQIKNEEPLLLGNELITFQDARYQWEQVLNDLLKKRHEHGVDYEGLIGQLRILEENIREYPSLSKQIQRINERFSRLIAYHDLLLSNGKRIIPQAEVARASAIMYEQVPALWATGQYPQLKVMLERLENFLNFYENTVELEVAINERRRPGFTQSLTPPVISGTVGLSPLINLARVLISAIDQRDRFMAGHSERVAQLAVDTAKKLNWSGADLEFIEIAALLHDIGKLSIPESILTKVKPLSEQEWKMIQMHPYYGAQIVKQINAFNRIVPWVYHHQEHWDGTGYPEGLAKKDIPPASSIIAVSEAFAMMTTDLPYRSSYTTEEALEKIREAAGTQFDPEVTEAFTEAVIDSTDKST